MDLKCINTKNYKLTEGKFYICLREEESYYFIMNDAGTVVRYIKELFEPLIIPMESISEPPHPLPPVPVQTRTWEDVENSFSFDINGIFKMTDLENEEQSLYISNIFTVRESSISCGIKEVSGLNSLFEIIDALFNDDDDYITEKQVIFKFILLQYNNIYVRGCALILYSTNLDNDYDGYFDVLDENCAYHTEHHDNPNSGNTIDLWTFVKN